MAAAGRRIARLVEPATLHVHCSATGHRFVTALADASPAARPWTRSAYMLADDRAGSQPLLYGCSGLFEQTAAAPALAALLREVQEHGHDAAAVCGLVLPAVDGHLCSAEGREALRELLAAFPEATLVAAEAQAPLLTSAAHVDRIKREAAAARRLQQKQQRKGPGGRRAGDGADGGAAAAAAELDRLIAGLESPLVPAGRLRTVKAGDYIEAGRHRPLRVVAELQGRLVVNDPTTEGAFVDLALGAHLPWVATSPHPAAAGLTESTAWVPLALPPATLAVDPLLLATGLNVADDVLPPLRFFAGRPPHRRWRRLYTGGFGFCDDGVAGLAAVERGAAAALPLMNGVHAALRRDGGAADVARLREVLLRKLLGAFFPGADPASLVAARGAAGFVADELVAAAGGEVAPALFTLAEALDSPIPLDGAADSTEGATGGESGGTSGDDVRGLSTEQLAERFMAAALHTHVPVLEQQSIDGAVFAEMPIEDVQAVFGVNYGTASRIFRLRGGV